ncbi:uncharacterized protein LOC120780715 [Bactrocera tryoni]|uniref:uncharacterized protein LOC120780715 n=1 Tax=Bactrocera tryoni TaxID=59916 RepID=UPI001A95BB8D|nr:uncharacterized protein LOC120780715 [Bactrocera tryoni]
MTSENSLGSPPENPFRRNSKILRTPPKGKNEETTAAGPIQNCENAAEHNKREKSEQMQNKEAGNIFCKVGTKIKELETMMSGQRHINQAMRDLVSCITSLYDKAENTENPLKRTMVGKSSQVSPILREKHTPKRIRELSGYLPPTKKPRNVSDKAQGLYSEVIKNVPKDSSVDKPASEKWVDVRLKLQKKPPLNDARKELRLNFSREHMAWKSDWRYVVFSDEKKFNLEGPDGYNYYFHDLRKEEHHLDRLHSRVGRVMVWGAISYYE